MQINVLNDLYLRPSQQVVNMLRDLRPVVTELLTNRSGDCFHLWVSMLLK